MSALMPQSAQDGATTLSRLACHVCGAQELAEIAGYSALPRVTSDCKPFAPGGLLALCGRCGAVQKPATARWRDEASLIYRDYDIYFQSGGVEQSVFDPARGIPRLRSAVLLDHVDALRPLGPTGRVLDVGCGKGTFLSAFQKFRPGWRLFGHELSRANESILMAIPGFEQLFVGQIPERPDGFDLITLVHALEHFEEPMEGLRDLAPKLAPGGMLVVQVPNAGASPFDLAVADHASHFTRDDLARLAQRAGLTPLVVADDWMAKELSLVAVRSDGAAKAEPVVDIESVEDTVFRKVAWLGSVLDQARNAAGKATRFGIFGTSISAMWLYGELASQVDFFVDEDPGRIGELHGRPVVTPDRIPDQATVFLALLPGIARAVAARIGRSDINLEVPPAF